MFIFRIELYTSDLLISGNYELQRYQRLSDILNSDLKQYMTLQKAIIGPQNQPQKSERVSQILVERNKVLFIATLTEPTPPPDHIREEQIAAREVEQVMFFTYGFALRANFYKFPNKTLEESLNYTGNTFLPLSDVSIFPYKVGKPVVRNFVAISQYNILAAYATKDHESI